MLSEKSLQHTLERIREISEADLAVYDHTGKVVASAAEGSRIPTESEIAAFAGSGEDEGNCRGFSLAKTVDEDHKLYIVAAAGGKDSFVTAGLTALQISGFSAEHRNRQDKDNFIKNLLLDNMLLIDVYSRAQNLHIEDAARRCVLLVQPSAGKKRTAMADMEMLFGEEEEILVTVADDNGIVIIRELGSGEDYDVIKATAEKILGTLGDDGETYVSYGTIVSGLRNLSRSFKEAGMAVDVGKIFLPDRRIISYSELGIGRLIYQLPVPLCRMFIREIFDEKSPDEFDEETIATINKFFENNLNVSETSRQLYIHRNTLVYRLDKLQKTTGLDLRVFEDAITLKIAMMVVKYMKYKETDRRSI